MEFRRISIERVSNGWIVRCWEGGEDGFEGDDGPAKQKKGVFVEHTEEAVLSRISKLLRGSTL